MGLDRTQKYAIDMDLAEFEAWSVGYITFGIGEGTSLRSCVAMIISQAAQNRVWGGAKPQPRDDLDSLDGLCPRAAVMGFLWLNRNIQCPCQIDDTVQFLYDRVKTSAKDKCKAIREAIRRLRNDGLVTITNGEWVGLSNKGLSLLRGKENKK